MSLEVLDKAVEDTKKQLDPLSPSTQLFLHNQNMTGGALIGVYANHNANHALMQHTDLGISELGSFTFDGENIRKLNQVKNKNNDFISKNNSGFLAASVDNVKDPVLAELKLKIVLPLRISSARSKDDKAKSQAQLEFACRQYQKSYDIHPQDFDLLYNWANLLMHMAKLVDWMSPPLLSCKKPVKNTRPPLRSI